MGVKERQERDREAVRRAILDAARELFVSDGYLNVSMRKIADRIEYSPAAIYSYFSSKDDIFFALAEEGFQLLLRERPAGQPADPIDAVRRIFWHYYEFSKRHPEYFGLMFVDRSVPRISRDWERFGFVREMRAQLARRIEHCIELGLFPRTLNPEAAFHVLAAAVHGAAVFNLCDRLAPGASADALARDVIEAALTGLRHGSPVSFDPSHCRMNQPAPEPGHTTSR